MKNTEDNAVEAGSAVQADDPRIAEKAAYWFNTLLKCARLLDVDVEESIPQGVLDRVTKLVVATHPAQPLGYLTKESMSHLRNGASVMAAIHTEVEPDAPDFFPIYADPTGALVDTSDHHISIEGLDLESLGLREAPTESAAAPAEPAGWREFIENIATPYSEPLNSVVAYRDIASRKDMMGELRAKARALLATPQGETQQPTTQGSKA